jgi:oligopeptidase A
MDTAKNMGTATGTGTTTDTGTAMSTGSAMTSDPTGAGTPSNEAGNPGAGPDPGANPLLDQDDLPRFAGFQPVHVTPAVDSLLQQADEALTRAVDPQTPATWDDFVLPLQEATERLGRAWGMVRHLNSVMDSPALREAFNQNLPRVTEFWTRLGQNEGLFSKYKALRASEEFGELDAARAKVVENELRDFRLSGAELKSPGRERFAAIQEELAAAQQRFSENVLDSTSEFELLVEDPARLEGLPPDAIAAARADAERKGRKGWRFTLQFPSYLPVMQYAADRTLREQLYRAYVTRAADGSARDNTALIRRILALRQEKARILGFDSFADVSLVAKMADSPKAVETFLLDLAQRARPFAVKDLDEVRQFAAERLGLTELQAWDVPYASEHLKQERYSFSDNEVKQYFQLPRVLDGLFKLIERMFSVRILPDAAETWHPDVRFFRIESAGGLVGQFYLDLYARDSKQSGAWMDDCRGRTRIPVPVDEGSVHDLLQTPVAYLVCNFQPPVDGAPALLTHDDVSTLFHEFGHGLHHMLTRVDALGVSGIAGVEWDAVELPSQFMENWAWEWEIVESMSRHVATGQPMSQALFDKMVRARNFQAGLQTLRQIEFSLFDMELHRNPGLVPACGSPAASIRGHAGAGEDAGASASADAAAGDDPVQRVLDHVRDQVAVIRPPSFNRFQNSFSHIFAGGYAAGYYSYKWAEVLSADCFAAFEEEGLFNPETGARFLREILSVGGSRPAIDSFKAFRGREPRLEALLRHNGMVEEAA